MKKWKVHYLAINYILQTFTKEHGYKVCTAKRELSIIIQYNLLKQRKAIHFQYRKGLMKENGCMNWRSLSTKTWPTHAGRLISVSSRGWMQRIPISVSMENAGSSGHQQMSKWDRQWPTPLGKLQKGRPVGFG